MRILGIGIVVLALLACGAAMAVTNDVSYDGVPNSYMQCASGPNGSTTLNVNANVDWAVFDSLTSSNVTFNFRDVTGPAGNIAPVDAVIPGHTYGNTGSQLFDLSVTGGTNATCDISNLQDKAGNKIPVAWFSSMDSGATWQAAQYYNSGNGQVVSAIPIPTSGNGFDCHYAWKITATAPAFTPAGAYTMDPICSIIPVLK